MKCPNMTFILYKECSMFVNNFFFICLDIPTRTNMYVSIMLLVDKSKKLLNNKNKQFPFVYVYSTGAEFEGAFVFLLHLFSTKKDMSFVLRKAFLRQNLPNLLNFLMTIFVFVTVIYLKVGQTLNFTSRDLFSLYKYSPHNRLCTNE